MLSAAGGCATRATRQHQKCGSSRRLHTIHVAEDFSLHTLKTCMKRVGTDRAHMRISHNVTVILIRMLFTRHFHTPPRIKNTVIQKNTTTSSVPESVPADHLLEHQNLQSKIKHKWSISGSLTNFTSTQAAVTRCRSVSFSLLCRLSATKPVELPRQTPDI